MIGSCAPYLCTNPTGYRCISTYIHTYRWEVHRYTLTSCPLPMYLYSTIYSQLDLLAPDPLPMAPAVAGSQRTPRIHEPHVPNALLMYIHEKSTEVHKRLRHLSVKLSSLKAHTIVPSKGKLILTTRSISFLVVPIVPKQSGGPPCVVTVW